jgi:hypothetical protein
MTSLQQVAKARIVNTISARAVCVHRRSLTLLLVDEKYVFFCSRQDVSGKWIRFNDFSPPPDVEHVLGCSALEAYNCFVVVARCTNQKAVAIFLDLSSNLMNTWPLTAINGAVACDIDQHRRELVIVNAKSETFSVALRSVKDQPVNPDTKLLFEALVRMKGAVVPRPDEPPLQVCCQDLIGSFLILHGNGRIAAFETATLDVLWILEPTIFIYKPVYLVVDKFGPGFFVYASSTATDKAKSYRLEYCCPPDTSVGCSVGQFSRAVIPLTEQLVNLSLETAGLGLGTVAVIVQVDRQVFFWRVAHKSKVTLESKLVISSGEASVFRSNTILGTSSHGGSVVVPTASSVGHSSQPYLPGILCLSPGFGIPNSPVAVTITVGNVFVLLSMHEPKGGDQYWLGISHSDFRNAMSQADTNAADEESALDRLGKTFGLSESRRMSAVESGGEAEHGRDGGGKMHAFSPLLMLDSSACAAARRNLSVELKDGSFGLVLPTALVVGEVVAGPGKDQRPSTDIRVIQRAGLYRPSDAIPASVLNGSIDVTMGCFAYRSRKIVVATNLKELFWMDLSAFPNEANRDSARPTKPSAPIKVGVDVQSQTVSLTYLVAADVFLKLPTDRLTDSSARPNVVSGGIVGEMIFTVVGDSTGAVHFFLTSSEGVIQQGQFAAHSSPIAAVLLTGDPIRPLWRIGTSTSDKDAKPVAASRSVSLKLNKTGGTTSNYQITCNAIPGSAIVTIARDGEVKVWQPVFSPLPGSRPTIDRLMNMVGISWRMSGLFAAIATPGIYVSSASVDPTCMTALIATSNGFVIQWPIPGLVDAHTGSLASVRESVYSCKRHFAAISSMRVWVDAPNSTVQEVSGPDITKAGMITATRGPLSGTIGYTSAQLQTLCGNSTMASSSIDCSVVLWRFSLSNVLKGPDGSTKARYLNPIPCRKLFFSSVPRAAICVPVLHPSTDANKGRAQLAATGSSLTWKASAILNGIVVDLAEGPFYSLMNPEGFGGERSGATLERLASGDGDETQADEGKDADDSDEDDDTAAGSLEGNTFLDSSSNLRPGASVPAIPLIGHILKPNRLVAVTQKQIPKNRNSWTLLSDDWLHRAADTEVDQMETALNGLGEVLYVHPRQAKLYAGRSRPSSADRSGIDRGRSRSRSPSPSRTAALPDHKITVGVEPEISVMTGVRLPTDDPDFVPTRDDGLIATSKSGFRVLVTADHVNDKEIVVVRDGAFICSFCLFFKKN